MNIVKNAVIVVAEPSSAITIAAAAAVLPSVLLSCIIDIDIVHSTDNRVTVHNVAAFNSDDFSTSPDALSIRNMNIADVAAAAILHNSPTVIVDTTVDDIPLPPLPTPPLLLSNANNEVPINATNADNQLRADMDFPYSTRAKNGTSLTFK